MKLRWRVFTLLGLCLALAACEESNPCEEKTGSVLCGYCNQDVVTSGNPHAGQCLYCGEGSTCSGDVCGNLECVGSSPGGSCLNCACPQYSSCNSCGGTFCKNNLCSPAGWCCPGRCSGCGCQ